MESTTNATSNPVAEFLTLTELRKQVLPGLLAPIPDNHRLRRWFRGLPRLQHNGVARRGTAYYSVSAVEDWVRSHIVAGK